MGFPNIPQKATNFQKKVLFLNFGVNSALLLRSAEVPAF